MRKLWIVSTVMMLALALAGTALAQAGTVVVKGEVTAISATSLTLDSPKDGTVSVSLPAGLALPALQTGDTVMVKATRQADGSLAADMVRLLGGGNQGNNGNGRGKPDHAGRPEASGKLNNAYCADGKQTQAHPVALKIAQTYNVGADWVMGYFCNGQSMGAIMLALKTSQLNGADPAALLAQRSNGVGWGKIWQQQGLIGREAEVKTPPGQLNKTPPGQAKKK